eukprot:scaffold427_cov103-Alexandrium_tamarense.AAC.28
MVTYDRVGVSVYVMKKRKLVHFNSMQKRSLAIDVSISVRSYRAECWTVFHSGNRRVSNI